MFDQLFSLVNFYKAWKKFRSGKTRKMDVVSFEYHLDDNILFLHDSVDAGEYVHKEYEYFQVFDNKKRDIFKADVSDRIIHQIIYDYLLSIYEPIFIADSYSSRINKGHHKAVATLRYFIKLASSGNKKKCFILKCDVKKYFDSIDQNILLKLIKEKIECPRILLVIQEIIFSFDNYSNKRNEKTGNKDIKVIEKIGGKDIGRIHGKGIPLGNVTSQIFANIYLNSLDVFIKKNLRCRFYVRYNDDLAIVSDNKNDLSEIRDKIIKFTKDELALCIPFEKTSLRKVSWGIDFLGYVILQDSMLLRDKTKGKMYEKVDKFNIYSYLGILKHCNSYNLRQKVISKVFGNGGDLYNE